MTRKISLLLVIVLLVSALAGCATATDTVAAVEAIGKVSDAMEAQSAMVQEASEAMDEAASEEKAAPDDGAPTDAVEPDFRLGSILCWWQERVCW